MNSDSAPLSLLAQSLIHTASHQAYFEHSSSSVLIPNEAVEELDAAFEAYDFAPFQSWHAVPYALERLSASIRNSITNRQMLDNESLKSFLHTIEHFTRTHRQTRDKKRQWEHFKGHIDPIRSTFCELSGFISSEFPKYLRSHINAAFAQSLSVLSQQRKVRKVAPELAAYLNYLEKDTITIAKHFIDTIENSQLNPTEQRDIVTNAIDQEQNDYLVATVITGAVDAEIPSSLEARTVTYPGPIHWEETSAAQDPCKISANAVLAKFCFEHWNFTGDPRSINTPPPCQIILWKIQAHDAIHARHFALDKAEAFMDLINAKHRSSHFGVKRKVLVWNPASGDNPKWMHPENVAVTSTQSIDGVENNPSAMRSLRFASKANAERAGSLKTMFSWIALEYLARGQRSPQNFIAKKIPMTVALASLKQAHLEMWFMIEKQAYGAEPTPNLLNFLRPNSNEPNRASLKNLVALLTVFEYAQLPSKESLQWLEESTSTTPEACRNAYSELMDLYKQLTQFEKYRFHELQTIMTTPAQTAAFLTDTAAKADICLQRMRFVRNQTAHSTTTESQKYRNLSGAAYQILDCCFEALADSSPHSPVETFQQLENKFKELRRQCERKSTNTFFDPQQLLRTSTLFAHS